MNPPEMSFDLKSTPILPRQFVCGFLEDEAGALALVEKGTGAEVPENVRGKWNGIGGSIEVQDDHPIGGQIFASPALLAMEREFYEETQILIPGTRWRFFCELQGSNWGMNWTRASAMHPENWRVFFFHLKIEIKDGKMDPNCVLPSQNDVGERMIWVNDWRSSIGRMVPNLEWLIPMMQGDRSKGPMIVQETLGDSMPL